MTSPTPSLNRRSTLIDYLSSSLPKRTRLPSLRSRKSTASVASNNNRDSFYAPYAVHQQNMAPIILRDPEATARLLETILDAPGGRRMLCRLARTCKAFKDPALDLLWRDLDTVIPLVTLFPNALLKRARRPALGLIKSPEGSDWEAVLAYGERVRSITYVEAFNTISQTIFPIFEQVPREHLLPNLTSLTWKAETAPGLAYCKPFLNPQLKNFTLEMGVRAPRINEFLDYVLEKTQLTSFSFTLHSNLPDAFVEKMQPNRQLEKLALMAPGSLAAKVGKWTSGLPSLKNFQLDLTNSSTRAVEGFFTDIAPGSGFSTPSSVGGTDGDVLPGDNDGDFSEIRKSAARLTSDYPRKGAFTTLTQLSLSGETANIATFLKHITSPLVTLDLAIEDPPARDDWQDLCRLMCEHFGRTLQVLRISASTASRFSELVRSTSRGGDVQLQHLTLEHFGPLPCLQRLEIELPESAIFHNVDLVHLARVCPNVEVVRLCGQARFPQSFGPPYLTLEGIIPLTSACTRLHTLSVVVNALDGRDETYKTMEISSRALMRLHVGHSWVKDALQTALLISHIAPHLETLKWFPQASRSGVVELHATNWQKVNDFLPPVQHMRLIERSLKPKSVIIEKPKTAEKEVDATVHTSHRGVQVKPEYADVDAQVAPQTADVEIEALPETHEVEIDATPVYVEHEVHAIPEFSDFGVNASPDTEEKAIDVFEPVVEEVQSVTDSEQPSESKTPPSTFIPSINDLVNLPLRVVQVYTYYLTFPVRYMLSFVPSMPTALANYADTEYEPKSPVPESPVIENGVNGVNGVNGNGISEKHMPHMNHMSSPSLHELSADENDMDINPDIVHATIDSNAIPAFSVSNEGVFYFALEARREAKVSIKGHVGDTPLGAFYATRQSLGSARSALNSLNHFHQMADPKKQEKDYTKEVDELLPQTKALAQSAKLQEAVDKLLVLEKQTRNASDLSSTTRLVKETCQLCYDARDYTLLNSSIHLLSKKHGQLKGAIQGMVELVMDWLDAVREREGTEKWLELVETLRSVTEGKIFLETPRARVTLQLAQYHEVLAKSPTPTSPPTKESKQVASDLLSDLQVETYSSMERREKTEFLLEQMRFLIMIAREKDTEKGVEGKKDAINGGESEWIKVRVAGRKVNESFLTQKENEDLKLKYYDMMIQYALHHSEYLDAAKHYYKVWETPTIKAEETGRGKEALESIVYYVVLAPHDNEQSDMLHRLFNDSALSKLELHYALVKCFTTPELMRWPGIETIYGPHLRKTSVFSSDKLWEDLHTRVIEHNIRIVGQYYTRITLPRLTSLLDLTQQQTEEILCRLVVSGSVWARVDRPTGIVSFRQARTAEDVMNDWSSDMSRLLGLVEKTWMGVNAAQAAQSRVKA